MQALEGIKVLDLCRNAPGMFCTTVLADLGADVLMVERPMDEARSAYEKLVAGIDGEEDERRHAAFNVLQRNKRSIALNLKEPEAQQIFHKLAEPADVVVEGFRPGVLDRLGAGYEKVRSINPRVVYCSVSGYGQDGLYSQMAGHDINYISFAGALGLIGEQDGRPAIPLNLIADYAGGGLCGAVGILSALMAREKTGSGQYVDIAMSEGVLYMLSGLVSDVLSRGISAERGGNRLNGGAPYYNVYRTKDDKYFSVAAIEPWFWENLCRILGREDFIAPQRPDPEVSRERIRVFQEIFLTKTRDEWVAELMHAETCVTPVYSLDEVAGDRHFRERGSIVEAKDPESGSRTQVGMLFKMSETPGSIRSPAPAVGQDTDEVLRELGYKEAQIKTLAAAGAAGRR